MPVLVQGKPLEQREPVLVVQNRFEPGVHRFSLVVVDERGIESEPDVLAVTVRRAIVVTPGTVVLEPVIVRPDPIDPVVVNRIDTPALSTVVSPLVRPRGKSRKGKTHGPE